MSLVKLGDVVMRANTKENKDNTDREFYVGGEHIISNEPLITRRGIIAGSTIGPMFYFGFKKGQVLFVSRNPHLRKAGMVTFDGICSEKTFVLETKDNSVLLQRYLPFVLQSDHFWSYAESHKSGSVNFFINWSTLSNYEFDLPSIAKQKSVSDLLWAIEDTKQAYLKMISATDELVKSQFIEMFGDPIKNTQCWPTKKMSDVAPASTYDGDIDIVDGKSWLLNLDAIESHSRKLVDKAMTPVSDIGASTFKFSTENVLYSKLRPYLNKLYIPTEPGYATTELVPLTPDLSLLDPLFLASLIQGNEFLSFIETRVSGTKMPRVQMNVFWDLDIILPPLTLQKKFVSFVEQSDKSKFELEQALAELTATYKRIITENLG